MVHAHAVVGKVPPCFMEVLQEVAVFVAAKALDQPLAKVLQLAGMARILKE